MPTQFWFFARIGCGHSGFSFLTIGDTANGVTKAATVAALRGHIGAIEVQVAGEASIRMAPTVPIGADGVSAVETIVRADDAGGREKCICSIYAKTSTTISSTGAVIIGNSLIRKPIAIGRIIWIVIIKALE